MPLSVAFCPLRDEPPQQEGFSATMSSEGPSEATEDPWRQTEGHALLLMDTCEDIFNFSGGNLAGNGCT